MAASSSSSSSTRGTGTNNYENLNLILDLDSIDSYLLFLNQLKDLGMTKSNCVFVLLTMGIHELELEHFVHGGAKLIGFSIIDYHNINTLRILSETIHTDGPLNKIPILPVNFFLERIIFFLNSF